MTKLLDRLDETASEVVSNVGTGEIVGWALITVGGVAAVVATGVVIALHFWGDLMTVGDFL